MTALSRLAPRTLIPTGEGAGGHTSLEPCDVAYALAGLPPGAAALLRAIYAQDHGRPNLRELEIWAWQEAAAIAVSQRWHVPHGTLLLRAMAARAVSDLVHPQSSHCPRCGGTGRVRGCRNNPSGDCRQCETTGRSKQSDADTAIALSLTTNEWRSIWAARYTEIADRIRGWHDDGLAHVRRRLRETDS